MFVIIDSLIGILLGWIGGSLIESIFHQHLGHSNKKLRDIFERIYGLGTWFKKAYESHNIVHHTMTYKKDHVTQFNDQQNPVEKVDADIVAKGINLKHIHSQEYGITLNFIGFLKFSLPFVLTWLPFAWYFWSKAIIVCITSLLTSLIAPAFSTWLHPYLHLKYKDAILLAPWPMNYLMSSQYGKFLWVYHWLHHKNRAINFNLMLFGDLVRGCYRIPTNQDMIDASKVGGPDLI